MENVAVKATQLHQIDNQQIQFPANVRQHNQILLPHPAAFQLNNQHPNFTHTNRFACLDQQDSLNTQNGEY